MGPAWNSRNMWNLLFRSAVCPKKGKPQHRTCWRLNLTSQTFNSGPISRSKLYVTLKLLVIYLKMGFEEAPSLFSLWSQHLWGAVEASSRPLSSHPGCRKGSKVRGDLSLAHHHLFFPFFFFAWASLALGADYHHIPATVTVYLCGQCTNPTSWLPCRGMRGWGSFPTFPPILYATKNPVFIWLINYKHTHTSCFFL